MEHKILSVNEWEALVSGENGLSVPILLHSTSGSMAPLIRINADTVTVIPCRAADVAVGDIVFVKYKNKVGYLLHRVIRIDGNIIQTMGDNMLHKDTPISTDAVLGKVVSIDGPGKHIDCTARRQRRRGRRRVRLIPLRPAWFFVKRVQAKIKHLILRK